jgi:glycosyltransferase involved in cell wall biosynthesis
MYDLSVIICSHNPRADFLRRTLDSLREQTLPFENWELLLVDNASAQSLATSWDLSWHPHAKHIAESELGLSAARQRGTIESASDLLVFLDDDTPLDKSYLTRALEIKRRWPSLGVWGSGSVALEYELQPDERFSRLLSYFGLRQTDRTLWSNVFWCVEATPWGAGSCIRANVADAYRRMNNDRAILISGRRGKALLSGEDREIAYVACATGFGTGVFPELKLTHLISKERVSRQYLLRLYEGTELSNALLLYKWEGTHPASPLRPRGLLSIVKNSILRRGLDRQMYFARMRAMISARRVIASSQPPSADDSKVTRSKKEGSGFCRGG